MYATGPVRNMHGVMQMRIATIEGKSCNNNGCAGLHKKLYNLGIQRNPRNTVVERFVGF